MSVPRALGIACAAPAWVNGAPAALSARQAERCAGGLLKRPHASCRTTQRADPMGGWVSGVGWLGGWLVGWLGEWVGGWLVGWVGGWLVGY